MTAMPVADSKPEPMLQEFASQGNTMPTASHRIGIFDSGIGGLSVAHAIAQLQPEHQLIYVADSLHAPYGEKSPEVIYQRMAHICSFLQAQQVSAIVVACNTATTAAIAALRAEFALPIIGVEPGIKPAVLASKTGVVAVLATARTLQNASFVSLTQRFAHQAKILLQACPLLVPAIEQMALEDERLYEIVRSYVQPLLAQGADTLVLGCTHYNFVAGLISQIAGPNVTVIRTEAAVARQLQQRLAGVTANKALPAAAAFSGFTSGDISRFSEQIGRLWRGKAAVDRLS